MSTTMLSGSSSSRKKATSTTKVAPCIFCAGPNTSPGRLWAIMMWSRTSTANIGGTPVSTIADQVAEGVGVFEDRAHPRRHLGEGRFGGHQDVQPRVGAEGKRLGQPSVVAPALAMRGRDRTHLRGLQGQPLAVEGAAEGDGDRLVAE